MTIKAKFESECGNCGGRIEAGQEINWERGAKATHLRPTCREANPRIGGMYREDGSEYRPSARIAIEDAGVYVMPNGDIVKVQANREKTRTYAKRWTVISGERLTEAGTRERGEYVFEAGLVQAVAAEGRKMTLGEATSFILRYGVCCRCGRVLKAADSVERGIGPVCMNYFGFGEAA